MSLFLKSLFSSYKQDEIFIKQQLQSLFENDKTFTCKLKEEINKTDKEIDKMVYKLDDLSEDEIEIVEEK